MHQEEPSMLTGGLDCCSGGCLNDIWDLKIHVPLMLLLGQLGGASGVPQQPLPTFPQQPVPAIRQLPAGTAVPTGAVNNAQQRLEPPFPRVQGEPPRQSPVRVTAGQQRAQRQEQPAVRSANPSPRPPPSLGSRNSNPPGPAGHPSRPSSAAGTPGHIFMPQDTPNPNPPTPHIGAEQADLFQPNYNVGNVAGLGLDMLPLMQNQLHPGQYEQHVGFGPLQQPGPPPDMQQQRRFTEWHVRHWLASEESRENAELAQMQRMEVNNVLDRHADEWRQLRQRQARRRAQHSPQQQQVAGMNINVPAMPNLGPGAFDFQF